jgi:hypothetical protein
MKELYIDMVDAAMDCISHGLSDNDLIEALEKEFGVYFTINREQVLNEAKKDLAAYHNDMMNWFYGNNANETANCF